MAAANCRPLDNVPIGLMSRVQVARVVGGELAGFVGRRQVRASERSKPPKPRKPPKPPSGFQVDATNFGLGAFCSMEAEASFGLHLDCVWLTNFLTHSADSRVARAARRTESQPPRH